MSTTKLDALLDDFNNRFNLEPSPKHVVDEKGSLALRVLVLEGDLSPGWVVRITEGRVIFEADPDHVSKADVEVRIRSSSDVESLISGAASLEKFFEEGRLKFSGDFSALSKVSALLDSLIMRPETRP